MTGCLFLDSQSVRRGKAAPVILFSSPRATLARRFHGETTLHSRGRVVSQVWGASHRAESRERRMGPLPLRFTYAWTYKDFYNQYINMSLISLYNEYFCIYTHVWIPTGACACVYAYISRSVSGLRFVCFTGPLLPRWKTPPRLTGRVSVLVQLSCVLRLTLHLQGGISPTRNAWSHGRDNAHCFLLIRGHCRGSEIIFWKLVFKALRLWVRWALGNNKKFRGPSWL